MLHKIVFLFVLTLSLNIFAFKLSPIKADFSDKGKGKTKSFRIINTTTESVRVEAEILTRQIDINNKETRNETADFTLYPPVLKVEPGKSKVLRVTYISSPVDFEKAYRLIVRQIPEVKKNKKDKVNLNIIFEYVASLYVKPSEKSYSDLKINKIYKKDKSLILEIENIGNSHTLLRKYKLNLSQNKNKKTLKFNNKDYKKYSTLNLLAKSKRKIIIPFDNKFEDGKISGKFVKD